MEPVVLANSIPLKTPLGLLIEPTNRCNFRCIFCPTGNKALLRQSGRPLGDMSLGLFNKLLGDIKSFPGMIRRIQLYKDGEPLLNPRLPEMIRNMKSAGICNDISTTSNGSLLTQRLAEELADSGLDSIRFSIASLTAAGYKNLTKTRYDYDGIREKIRLLHDTREKSKNGKLFIHVKILDFGLSEQEKTKFKTDFSFADFVNIDVPMNWDGSHQNDLTMATERRTALDGRTPLKHDRQVCPLPWYTLAINFNGLVSICCVDWSHKTIIGDANTENLVDIWNGEKMLEFRKMHAERRRDEHSACKGCDYLLGQSSVADLDGAKQDVLLAKPVGGHA